MSNLIEKAEKFMSDFLTNALAAIETIANGSAEEAATQTAITDLKTQLASDEADEAEVKQVVEALITKLAAAPTPTGTGSAGDSAPDSAA